MLAYKLLTPSVLGDEFYEIAATGAKAFPNTGFAPANPQHYIGSDAVRYAIALQQLRDSWRFEELTQAREWAQRFYIVMQEKDGTKVVSFRRGKKKGKPGLHRIAQPMVVKKKILYDAPFCF